MANTLNKITTKSILDATVATADIADDAVTSAKIADDAITSALIADNAVVTAAINADAITGAKIADDAVGAEHIEVLDSNLQFADNSKILLGTGDDTHLYHNGSHTYISHRGTGNLILEPKEGENGLTLETDGAAKLYYDNTERLATSATGVTIAGDLNLGDSNKIEIGASNDLEIYHDASHSYIDNTGAGNLYIKDAGAVKVRTASFGVDNADGSEAMIAATDGGSVDLYYNNVKTLETADNGFVHIAGASDVRLTLGSQGTAGNNDSNWLRGTSTNIMYNSASGNHTWEVGGTEKLRLQSGGGLSFNGDTAAANALDDYEEGTWTPDLGNFSALSFNSRTGVYTKVGRFVYASAHMNIASRTGGGGHMLLTGLPFTSHNTNGSGNGFIGYSAGLTGDTYDVPTVYVGANETQAYFYKGTGATFASQDMDMGSGSIHMTIIYEAA